MYCCCLHLQQTADLLAGLKDLSQHNVGAPAPGHTPPTAAYSQCVISGWTEPSWATCSCVHWAVAIPRGPSAALPARQ
jgi:hypothetical protein